MIDAKVEVRTADQSRGPRLVAEIVASAYVVKSPPRYEIVVVPVRLEGVAANVEKCGKKHATNVSGHGSIELEFSHRHSERVMSSKPMPRLFAGSDFQSMWCAWHAAKGIVKSTWLGVATTSCLAKLTGTVTCSATWNSQRWLAKQSFPMYKS